MKNLFQSIPILIAVLFSATGADEVVYAEVGKTVTLTPQKPHEANYLFWKQNADEIASYNHMSQTWTLVEKRKDRFSVSNSALIIKDLTEEDFGSYTFSKLEGTIQTFKLFKITVSTDKNLSSPLLPGESLTLNCNVEPPSNHKKPDVYWQSPERRENRPKVTVKVEIKHNGDWTCVVKHDNKEDKTTVSVTVMDLSPPLSHIQYTSQNTSLTIPCSIASHITWKQIEAMVQEVHWQFFPKLSSSAVSDAPQKLFSLSVDPLQWKPEQSNELNPVSDLSKGNLSLTRSKGKPEDEGDYVCTVKFKNGVTLTRTVHVDVLQILASPGTSLISGQQLNLTCGTGRSLPSDLHLKWIPPNQSVHPFLKSAPQLMNFTILVSTSDSGKWKCELWQGRTQLTSHSITLKIEPKLSVWMLVIICSAAVIVVLLLILVFILLRRRQRKMRHPRHQLCQCKNPKPKGFYKT